MAADPLPLSLLETLELWNWTSCKQFLVLILPLLGHFSRADCCHDFGFTRYTNTPRIRHLSTHERCTARPAPCTTNATTDRMIETSAIAFNEDPPAHGTTNIARGMVKLENAWVITVEIGHELALTFL